MNICNNGPIVMTVAEAGVNRFSLEWGSIIMKQNLRDNSQRRKSLRQFTEKNFKTINANHG